MTSTNNEPVSWWSWRGRTSRRAYAWWGVGLFFFKYNLDRLLAYKMAGVSWLPWSYFAPPSVIAPLAPAAGQRLALVLAITSLPFIVVGVLLTCRRLRDAAWPLWFTPLFFVPFGNVVFFLALCLLPAATTSGDAADRREPSTLRRMFTFSSRVGSAAAAVALTVILAAPVTALSTIIARNYGWGLFVGVPFFCGFLSALLHSTSQRRTLLECWAVASVAVLITGASLLLLAFEGLICIGMAVPIALPLAVLGATFGFVVQREAWGRRQSTRVYAAAWLILPMAILTEARVPHEVPRYAVTTSIEIEASAQTVWQHVVSFAELPPPTQAVFRSGIAYPIRASISGTGVGAIRHCEFSTGPFVEPITVWDEPRRLSFDVTSQPEPMREVSPYRAIHPPHLDGFFRSRRGEFRLIALSATHTRLEGTTWYEQRLWPATYWRHWSDWLVHTIHARVLTHIKAESEAATGTAL